MKTFPLPWNMAERIPRSVYDFQGKQRREETDGEKGGGARKDIQKETWTFV